MPSTTHSTGRASALGPGQKRDMGEHNLMSAAGLPGNGLGSGAPTTGASAAAAVAAAAAAGSQVQHQQLGQNQLRLATLLLERGRHGDALAALQPLAVQQPANPELLCLQGRCFAAAGSRPQALAAFAAALMGAPGCVAALVGCAAVHKDSGLLPEALAALEKALELLEAPTRAAAGAGAVGNGQAAAAAATTAAGELPQSAADVRLALAVVLTDLGQWG